MLDDLTNLDDYEVAIATNTPDVPFASYATLIIDELTPGEYFAKIEQESIPGLPSLSVFNYTLDVEFQRAAVVAPIINLLLDGD